MDFKLHQLSGSNLTSIFNNAYIEAETLKDTEFCAINGERNMLLIAYSEHNILQYQNWVYFSKDFTEEDANRFAKEINKHIVITRGDKGAISIFGNEITEIEADKNLIIKDLTGAGDLFAAGYLHSFINNLSIRNCLEQGTKLSSKVIQQIGARL